MTGSERNLGKEEKAFFLLFEQGARIFILHWALKIT